MTLKVSSSGSRGTGSGILTTLTFEPKTEDVNHYELVKFDDDSLYGCRVIRGESLNFDPTF
jgi:hypothetical protein